MLQVTVHVMDVAQPALDARRIRATQELSVETILKLDSGNNHLQKCKEKELSVFTYNVNVITNVATMAK